MKKAILLIIIFLGLPFSKGYELLSQSFPIAPFSDTLFYISSGNNLVTAKERAELIKKRIIETANENFTADSIRISNNDSNPTILIQEKIILTIFDNDTIGKGKSKIELAKEYKSLIIKAINKKNSSINVISLSIKIGIGLITIIILFLFLKYNGYVFNKLRGLFDKVSPRFIRPIKINDFELISINTQNLIIHKLISLLKLASIIIVSYIALPILFSLIPGAESLADKLLELVLNPVYKMANYFINYIPNLITIIVIMAVFRYINIFIRYLSKEIELGNLKFQGFFPEWALPTYNIARFVLIALMFITIFPYLPGSNSPIFQGVSVFIGILFSLGSSNAISNIISGLVITYMRSFKIGDRIKISDVVGDVVSRDLLVTRIRTPKNEIITIPNQAVLSNNVTNYSILTATEGLIIHSTVTIGYDVHWEIVHKLLINAALKTMNINTEKEPFVLQTSLDDFYVSYQINAYIQTTESIAMVYSDLHKNIQDEFNKAKVEIMSPHYRANRDGSEITIPSV